MNHIPEEKKKASVSSRYEKEFYHNNHRCRILWGYYAAIGEFYLLREEDGKTIFLISTKDTTIPHPFFPHITGPWRIEEMLDIFKALSEHIPQEHIDALAEGRPF